MATKKSGEPAGDEQGRPAEIELNSDGTSKSTTPDPSTLPRVLKRASTTSLVPHTPSSTNSPKTSREASPVRPTLKSGVSANSSNPRSRKNSTDLSPNRGPGLPGPIIPAVPSAAAIQRALSVAGAHQLQPPGTSDPISDPTRTQKSSKPSGLNNNQLGANLPRVKSPPPLTPKKGPAYSPRRPDQPPTAAAPSIIVDRPLRTSGSNVEGNLQEEESSAHAGMRTPVRGVSSGGTTLETVQESGDSPPRDVGAPSAQQASGRSALERRPDRIDEKPTEEDLEQVASSRPESGNESGGSKGAGKDDGKELKHQETTKKAAARPLVVHPKKSFTQLHPARGKTGAEGSVKNMTVETETVSSVPQVALGGGAGERGLPGRSDTAGSLRLKPSTETIRPKKDKKRVVRKAPSLNAGTGGLPSRRFHHHHPFSRAPSPEPSLTRSNTTPEFVFGILPECVDAESSLRSIDRRGAHSSDMSGDGRHHRLKNTRTSSRAVLTGVRGRVASSKADIFEAKVASAVDEANSSDSEETFVYESNPPESLSSRPNRYHSRTPSATSMASQIDQYGGRARQDGLHSVAGKKSMKFANSSYHSNGYPDESGETGIVRGQSQSGRGTPSHHHIGRYGRNGGHTSLFDNESIFQNAAKPLRSQVANVARLSPRPSSPRNAQFLRVSGSPRKTGEAFSYDLEGEGADDERTPLIGSGRSSRTRNIRRAGNGSLRSGYATDEKPQRTCGRVTMYTLLAAVMTAVIAMIIILGAMGSKPLMEVRIKDIRNVLASEQEIMLDLHVHAINPNLLTIQVSDLDINIFAKSKHVGTNALWGNHEKHGHHDHPPFTSPLDPTSPPDSFQEIQRHDQTSSPVRTSDGVDEGTDPIDDPETDSQTMLLGRIFEFDSPLVFDPSPIKRRSASSLGEVRLARPGNKTEQGGSARWEKVIQYDFELIVRGVIKYSLPFSLNQRARSASVGSSVVVHPGYGVDRTGSMIVTKPQTPYSSGSNTLLRQRWAGWRIGLHGL